MSDIKTYTGKIKLFKEYESEDELKTGLLDVWESLDDEERDGDYDIDDGLEYALEQSGFIIVGRFLYRVVKKEEIDEYGDFCNLTKVGDGFEFTTQFYNGGTHLSEMLSDALKEKISKKD